MERFLVVFLLVFTAASCGPPDERAIRDHIAATFLGEGPTAEADERFVRGRWSGFPPGSRVRVVVSNSVCASCETADNLTRALRELEDATGGLLQLELVRTDDADPWPAAGEVTLAESTDLVNRECPPDSLGCAQQFSQDGVMQRARCLVVSQAHRSVAVHEVLGHALLGWFHVTERAVGWRQGSIITGRGWLGEGATGLTELDRAAVERVFAAGVQAGSYRRDFVAAGLLDP